MLKSKKDDVCWYAMSAIYRSELKVKEYLDSRNIECYIPMIEVLRTRRGRKIKESVPAVCNLIFVHSTSDIINDVKIYQPRLQFKTMVIDCRNERIKVPDAQMEAFIKASSDVGLEKKYVDPLSLNLRAGQRVKVTLSNGTEVVGVIISHKKNKKTIVINAGNVIALTFDGEDKALEILE